MPDPPSSLFLSRPSEPVGGSWSSAATRVGLLTAVIFAAAAFDLRLISGLFGGPIRGRDIRAIYDRGRGPDGRLMGTEAPEPPDPSGLIARRALLGITGAGGMAAALLGATGDAAPLGDRCSSDDRPDAAAHRDAAPRYRNAVGGGRPRPRARGSRRNSGLNDVMSVVT